MLYPNAKTAPRPAPGRRAAVIAGLRTPFCRAGTDLAELDVLELARAVTTELVLRTELDPRLIDAVVYANVARPTQYHNLARELVLAAGLPARIPAATVSLACAGAARAITEAVDQIERGYADVLLAGGVEMLSNPPVSLSPALARALMAAGQAKSMTDKVQSFAALGPADLAPVPPAIKETSTGLSMGESAELMAKLNRISRQAQDEYALRSHRRAAAGWDGVTTADGRPPTVDRGEGTTDHDPRPTVHGPQTGADDATAVMADAVADGPAAAARAPAWAPLRAEVAPVYIGRNGGRAVTTDNHIRRDTSLERLAALRPVFDASYGTVTAGNSSPLTDGAATVLLMSEAQAEALGYRPKAFVRSYAYWAVDPGEQLLLGPAYAIPLALDRAGLKLSDIGVIEMHEAFAAQVLSTLQQLDSREFAERELGRSEAVGSIDPANLNRWGGSIALGHPFGATGARLLTTLANELARSDTEFGLVSVCAAGGVGVAIVLERG